MCPEFLPETGQFFIASKPQNHKLTIVAVCGLGFFKPYWLSSQHNNIP